MVATLKITSEVFSNNGSIPTKYTCEGENINPPLIISNLPMNTKTLVLIMEDQDAPKGTFIHWLVWNISPTNKIRENVIPGDQGFNDFKKQKYSGPCPPSGIHRYYFKIYALDNFLHLDEMASKAELETAMSKHVIGFGEIVGTYRKKLSK